LSNKNRHAKLLDMDTLALKRRFMELFNASGWTQAETARRMELTRGGINGIVTGPTTPSPGTVRFLELLMLEAGLPVPGRTVGLAANRLAHVPRTMPAPVAELAGRLNEIHALHPRKFGAIETMIESIHHEVKMPPATVVSSGTKPARKRLLGKAAASVRKPASGSAA
jgi:transcriptional regulator with XRE-family HTH domain